MNLKKLQSPKKPPMQSIGKNRSHQILKSNVANKIKQYLSRSNQPTLKPIPDICKNKSQNTQNSLTDILSKQDFILKMNNEEISEETDFQKVVKKQKMQQELEQLECLQIIMKFE